jgi:hypothetical protein
MMAEIEGPQKYSVLNAKLSKLIEQNSNKWQSLEHGRSDFFYWKVQREDLQLCTYLLENKKK